MRRVGIYIVIVTLFLTVPYSVYAYIQGTYYSQSGYYSQGGYYTQSSYYSQSSYYTQSYYQSYYQGGYALTLTGNVQFEGDLNIGGTLTKGAGTFMIDHPLRPHTHLLFHSFVESPDVKNIYDGIAELDEKGEVTIGLPKYFDALNSDFRYQFFPLDEPMAGLYILKEIQDNQFTIGGGSPGGRISWQVTGIRQDPFIIANPIETEVVKGPEELVDVGECLFELLCE